MPQAVDTLVHAQWVVTVEPDCRAREKFSVAIQDRRIVAVLEQSLARTEFQAVNEFDLNHHVLIPGFINTHTHAAMTLFRGLADDIALMDWLQHHIWPAETQWVNEQFVRTGTELAIAEMLLGGTTCFNDMYFFPDIVAEVAQDIGMRASVGLIQIDFPTAWAQTHEEYLARGLQLHDKLRNWDLVTTAFAPHAPYTVSDKALEKIRTLADELDIPIHMHVHETGHEIKNSLDRFKVRPLERLSRLSLLTPRLLAVHMTQLLPAEIDALAECGVHVVHCPESNLKLASGLCPVADLLGAGINVAIGTDGAASNNDLDMLSETKTAALLAKGVSGHTTSLPAHQALRMATLNGAAALGLDDCVGSLVAGKYADLVAIDLRRVNTQPTYDPVTQIVYSAGREQVSDVWIGGRRLVSDGKLTTIDLASLMNEVDAWADKIRAADRQRAAEIAS